MKTLGQFIEQYLNDNDGIIASAYFYFDKSGNPCVVTSYADGGMDYLETFSRIKELAGEISVAESRLDTLKKQIKQAEKDKRDLERLLKRAASHD